MRRRQRKNPVDFRKTRRFYVSDESPLVAHVEKIQAINNKGLHDRRHTGEDCRLQSIGLGGCGFYSNYRDAMNFLRDPKINVQISMGPNTRHVKLEGNIQYCASVADDGQVRYFLGVQFQNANNQSEAEFRALLQQAASAGFLEAI